MEFRGFDGFQSELPNVEVRTSDGVFDLHNAAQMDGFEFDWDSRTAWFRWTVYPDQWLKEAAGTRGRLIITLRDVSDLRLDGRILAKHTDGRVLDYVEYLPDDDELVIALVSGAQVIVRCKRCDVRVVQEDSHAAE
jgi:hypothetical protein